MVGNILVIVAVTLSCASMFMLGMSYEHDRCERLFMVDQTAYAMHVRAVQRVRMSTLRQTLYAAQMLCRSRQCEGCPCKPTRCSEACCVSRLSEQYLYTKDKES